MKSQRAFGGISTLWLYIAAGGAMVDGLFVFNMMINPFHFMVVDIEIRLAKY